MTLSVGAAGIAIVAALLAWGITHGLLIWRPPHTGTKTADDLKIHRFIRSFAPAIVGAVLGTLWTDRLGFRAEWGLICVLPGALIGAVIVLYLMMLASVPGHAVAIINLAAVADVEGPHKPPYVWPMDLSVRKLGSITWLINRNPGPDKARRALIRFEGKVPEGKPENYFKGSPFGRRTRFEVNITDGQPAVIAVGPVVNSGKFPYIVEIFDDNNNLILQTDPMADIPKG
jgi:hypothetical protein